MGDGEEIYVHGTGFEALFENAGDALFVLDEKGRFTWCNKVALDTLGFAEQELVGKEFARIISPESVEKAKREFATHMAGKSTKPYEVEVVTRKGQKLPVEINSVPFFVRGNASGVVGMARNLTERKKIEAELEESREEYCTVLETTGTAVMLSDEDMTISRVNGKFSDLTGYSKGEVEGRKKWTELVASPNELERMMMYHKRRMADPGSAPKSYHFKLVDKQGNVKNVLISVEVVPGTRKSVSSMIDVTERKRVEDAIKSMHEERDRELGRLKARVAELEAERRTEGASRP